MVGGNGDMIRPMSPLLLSLALLLPLAAEPAPATPPTTQILHLSGRDAAAPATWDFRCEVGRGCDPNTWTTIAVPSNWELQGFGTYNYGHDESKAADVGHYRLRFEVPEAWQGRTIELVLDGVMTDTEARLNGESVGPTHRGAFYRFRYDVTRLVRPGAENLLEVTVREASADASIERAERDADYWVFGGIFRPVWLRALPAEAIDHLAVDARHDGGLRARVRLRGLRGAARLVGRVRTLGGEPVGDAFQVDLTPGMESAELTARLPGISPWTAETPQLYRLDLELERAGETLHAESARFGFRTIEVRTDPDAGARGLFVNGRRVMLRGVNRHAFWPESGRALSDAINRRDVEILKSLHLNAVRVAHAPPDESFLDACDELGLYVIDELTGWKEAYSTEAGTPLVREMIERDVNHPSIVFWANGNEEGWNEELDPLFEVHDPQARPVLHPQRTFSGIDTQHYVDWDELASRLEPSSWRNRWNGLWGNLPLVLPTEVLHGLYDGGGGAGLADYWRALRASPLGAGLFLWAFADEAVARTDRGGELDTDGNHAPDGLLGPHREPSGGADAVREIFAPVVVATRVLGDAWDGRLEIENRFDHLDLAALRFDWTWLAFPVPGDGAEIVELDSGQVAGPPAPPGERGVLAFPPLPEGVDALRVRAIDPGGFEAAHWVLPVRERWRFAARIVDKSPGRIDAKQVPGTFLELTAGGVEARFDLTSGDLVALSHGDRELPLAAAPRRPDGSRLLDRPVVRHGPQDDGGYNIEARGPDGALLRWTLYPSGWLRLAWALPIDPDAELRGVVLPLAEAEVGAVTFLGRGPARIWNNRRAGGTLGVWRKVPAEDVAPRWAHEPHTAGFYADVHWAEFELIKNSQTLTVVLEADDLDLGLFIPRFPDDAQEARAVVPTVDGVGFYHRISAIGTKFHTPDEISPPRIEDTGLDRGVLWIHGRSKP